MLVRFDAAREGGAIIVSGYGYSPMLAKLML
jgi:hypothetical protein